MWTKPDIDWLTCSWLRSNQAPNTEKLDFGVLSSKDQPPCNTLNFEFGDELAFATIHFVSLFTFLAYSRALCQNLSTSNASKVLMENPTTWYVIPLSFRLCAI